jgi:CelD/BcsL family acetyltransferase involved in cellulose biosynthesis
MNLVIHTGKQALSLVSSEEFRAQWMSLYDACPWATGFQHPDFVLPWYELYQDRFLPVVVVRQAENGSLSGLLTLGLHTPEKKLVGAGERQAEYHAWLERSDVGNTFIQDAVKKLRSHFPGVDLYLKYLPSDIPLDWISANEGSRSIFSLRSHRRPVMRIDADNMDRQRRKKNHRQNFNRLNKTGDVSFEKIDDHGRFLRVFDALCMQYDFRQGALHHYMPFTSDPAKRAFYLELHKRGLLHTSVLNVGDEIAASHSGLVSKGNAVHLGINTHAPALAAHSPGNLLLAMLGVHLVDENMAALDLTPGGDGYKEHFATEHDTVHEMTVYGNVFRRWKTEAAWAAKRYVKTRMKNAGWSTADAWAAIGKLTRLRQLGFRNFLHSLREQMNASERALRYCPERPLASVASLKVSRNSLRDLMTFDPAGFSMTRWEFFKIAMERMERSTNVYSYVRGGRLMACCWIRTESAAAQQTDADKETTPPEKSIVLYDLLVHRELGEARIIRQFITQILSDIKDERTTQSIYFKGVLRNDLCEAVKECGFVDDAENDGSSIAVPPALSRDMQDLSTGA